jgi:hypothetical protein
LLHDQLSEAGNSPFLVLQKGIPRLDRVYYYNYEDATEAKQVEEERKKLEPFRSGLIEGEPTSDLVKGVSTSSWSRISEGTGAASGEVQLFVRDLRTGKTLDEVPTNEPAGTQA